jgi:DNA polymerase-3 subunit gamma/tau
VHVVGAEGRLLQLGFNNPGLRDNFHGSTREEVLREVLREITGTDWKIDALVDPSAGIGAPGPMPVASAPPPIAVTAPVTPAASPPVPAAPVPSPVAAPPPFVPADPPAEEDEPDPDDEDLSDAGPTARDLLVRELGATVLEERSDAD